MLIAVGVHLSVIVIGGRAVVLCFRIASLHRASPEELLKQGWGGKPEHELLEGLQRVDFVKYIMDCERLQFAAILLLLTSCLYSAFSLFTHQTFPVLLVAAAVMGGGLIFCTGFWEISVLNQIVICWVNGKMHNNLLQNWEIVNKTIKLIEDRLQTRIGQLAPWLYKGGSGSERPSSSV